MVGFADVPRRLDIRVGHSREIDDLHADDVSPRGRVIGVRNPGVGSVSGLRWGIVLARLRERWRLLQLEQGAVVIKYGACMERVD